MCLFYPGGPGKSERASKRMDGGRGREAALLVCAAAAGPARPSPPGCPLFSLSLGCARGGACVCFFLVCVSAKNLCFLERENHSCLAPPGETFRRRTCGAPVPPVPPHPALTHECEPPRVTGTGRAGRTPCPASPQVRRRRRWATCARARGGAPFHPPLLSPAAHTHSLPALHPPTPPTHPPPNHGRQEECQGGGEGHRQKGLQSRVRGRERGRRERRGAREAKKVGGACAAPLKTTPLPPALPPAPPRGDPRKGVGGAGRGARCV